MVSVLYFYSSTVLSCFSWLHFSYHISIMVSLCIVFCLYNHKINPWNILIYTVVRKIDWQSFNFYQIFFVFLAIRTIWESKMKHFIVYIVRLYIEKSIKVINFPAAFIEIHLHRICILVQFYNILLMKSSGAEYCFNSGFWWTTKPLNFSSHFLITCKLVPHKR